MSTANPAQTSVSEFIQRWQPSGSAERGNFQSFAKELCNLLGVPQPDPTRPNDRDNAYVFERSVHFDDGDGSQSTGWIDLYKRGCFVMEAKQGSDADESGGLFAPAQLTPTGKLHKGTAVRGTRQWDLAMLKARGQAERYVHALPASEGNPPFVVVVDVGHVIELYADFSRLGKTYTPFPDSQSHRIKLADLEEESIREKLRLLWTDPMALDPSRRTAKVTREVAGQLAKLAKSLEASGHSPESVAEFLMRCLFTFFAEDVKLIVDDAFTNLLENLRGRAQDFPHLVQFVWKDMDRGTRFSAALRQRLLRFNGGLFEHSDALPVNDDQLELLIEAGERDWSDVEPAIFGTLLERALDDRERHKLGAHYTPRAYVERLVLPTVIEPLREQWQAAQAAAVALNLQGKPEQARAELHKFLTELCHTTVLDPACGSGNFLYVTMEHMKRIEGEVRDLLRQFGETQEVLERGGLTVDPHQFLGLEINKRAVAIADLVLWIGFLQWHFRTHGRALPAEPVLKKFDNIKWQDAVLAYDKKELVLDDEGRPFTHWDGRTTKTSPITGEEVPDETARAPVYRYLGARPPTWPTADFVVGNPPFIGNKRMRAALGDGYVDELHQAYAQVPGSCDFVMYWWNHAAELVEAKRIRRFGLITTNSITQTYSSQVVRNQLATGQMSIVFAVPDHPWVDVELAASVRIAMTVGGYGAVDGILALIIDERGDPHGDGAQVEFRRELGRIGPNLQIVEPGTRIRPLRANSELCWQGCKLVGEHFQITPARRAELLRIQPTAASRLPAYWAGGDLTKRRNERYVVDFFGLSQAEAQADYPSLMQHIIDYVRPEREQNRDAMFRQRWWIFGRPRPELRTANAALARYIVTSEVAKHRTFTFLEWPDNLVDGSITAIASDDALVLGVLSSRIHVVWSLRTGGRLEDRPRYQNAPCFDPFPFPVCSAKQTNQIRETAERLDSHRRHQKSVHPDLTITDMYNVLEKLRRGEELTDKDKVIHEHGLVSVLRQIHDELDAAVAEAYGWPADLPDDEILRRLVALNAERADEESRGIVRWLRPDFQNPAGAATTQGTLALPAETKPAKSKPAAKPPFPKPLAEQARAVRTALQGQGKPVTAAELARTFKAAKVDKVQELLETLASLGQARTVEDGRFAA